MQTQDGGGSIINICSVSGMRPSPGSAAYGAAKAGLFNLTQTLAIEWAPKVRVNAVTPGYIETEQSHLYYGDEDGIAAVAAIIPLLRMGKPTDIGDACVFLASPLAGYVSGANLAVHGGGERPPFLAACQRRLTDSSVPAGRQPACPSPVQRFEICDSRSSAATIARSSRPARPRWPRSRPTRGSPTSCRAPWSSSAVHCSASSTTAMQWRGSSKVWCECATRLREHELRGAHWFHRALADLYVLLGRWDRAAMYLDWLSRPEQPIESRLAATRGRLFLDASHGRFDDVPFLINAAADLARRSRSEVAEAVVAGRPSDGAGRTGPAPRGRDLRRRSDTPIGRAGERRPPTVGESTGHRLAHDARTAAGRVGRPT